MKHIIFAASVLALGTVAISDADARSFNPAIFIGIDRNADNKISREEAVAFQKRLFATMDENGDGTVTFEEYVTANRLRSAVEDKDRPVPVPDDYKEADANKDKQLTLEEQVNVGNTRFDRLDKNKDGFVSRDEFVSPGL